MAVTDTVWDTVDTTDTDIPVLTVMPTTTLARGLLMPNLKPMLMLPLMPTMATTAVDIMAVDTMADTMAMDTMAVDTDMAVTDITVKLLLKQQIFKAIFPLL